MLHVACNVAKLYEISYVKGVERNKNTHNTLDLRHLSLMAKESKVHSIYNVDSDTKSLNYIKIRFKALIYFELQQTSN